MNTFVALKAFAAVIESGGFALAGRQIGGHVVCDTPGRCLGEKSRDTAAQLIDAQRDLAGMGESYFDQAVRVLGDLEYANLKVSEAVGPPRGLLRVSLPVTFVRLHIAPAIPAFANRYPDIRLDLTYRTMLSIWWANDWTWPSALAASKPQALLPARSHRRLVCASPEYYDQWGTPQMPADLAGYNWLTFSYTRGNSLWRFAGLSKDAVRVSGNLRSNNFEVPREAAVGGMGVVLLPSGLVAADIEAGRLRVVLRYWETGLGASAGPIYSVYLPNRRALKTVRAVVDLLVERFGSPP